MLRVECSKTSKFRKNLEAITQLGEIAYIFQLKMNVMKDVMAFFRVCVYLYSFVCTCLCVFV